MMTDPREEMRRVYREWSNAHDGQPPREMRVSPELFRAYDASLLVIVRQKPYAPMPQEPVLVYKATLVRPDPALSGMDMELV